MMMPGRGTGAAGTPANAGPTGAAGMTTSTGSMMAGAGGSETGTTGTGGPCGSGTPTDGRPTTGQLACIVEEHNAVRAMVKDTTTPLPPVTWSDDLAKYAQEWTDMTCMSPRHRSSPSLNGKPLGENLFAAQGGMITNAGKEAVDGWAGEVACYTFGKFMSGDKCDMSCTSQMHSDGCGHYTQVVWRKSIQIGCGVTSCGSGFNTQTEVICNYAPAGNYVGENPY
jgi:pathogenesis-related protein 1